MGLFDKPQQPGPDAPLAGRGKWLALTAALLGWLFDGFEMGLFPVISRPALQELLARQGMLGSEDAISFWNALVNSSFLIGAATGGVLFGWLGDRVGRVRAMSLSILTYAVGSGVGGFTTAPWQMVVIRFFAALGMGGEWSLGVALVMEVWHGRSRALLAGMIGAAANFGYLFVAMLSFGLGSLRASLAALNLPENWVEWRLLMVCGALPAVLTFFIRQFVPESESWERERQRGATSSWSTRDLLWVLAGVGICVLLLILWVILKGIAILLIATALAVVLVGCCYLAPINGYLFRAREEPAQRRAVLRTMVLGAVLSGIPLLATWGAVQWAPTWAHKLGEKAIETQETQVVQEPSAANEEKLLRLRQSAPHWKEYTQMVTGCGAILASLGGALLAGWKGRRFAYVFLCVTSLAAVIFFYQSNTSFGVQFLVTAFLAGGFSAAFYGWLPLFLPELFPTRIRATGQGFCFNFGRILAAIGVLQVPNLMGKPPDYARACSLLALIYVAGLFVIWFAPEMRGKPLPE